MIYKLPIQKYQPTFITLQLALYMYKTMNKNHTHKKMYTKYKVFQTKLNIFFTYIHTLKTCAVLRKNLNREKFKRGNMFNVRPLAIIQPPSRSALLNIYTKVYFDFPPVCAFIHNSSKARARARI